VELRPVDETTPVFRNFYIGNVFCNGAEKAIFVRGIPEMHVTDIVLENMVFQTNKGFDIQEASNILFKNIQIYTKETNPVIDITQSDHLNFEQIGYAEKVPLLFRINGERSGFIQMQKTDKTKAENFVRYELGAVAN
jgi:hypothetical protein